MATIAYNGIIYGNDTVELTKAEYDALGDKVLTDGITYFITDIDAEGGSASGCNAVDITETEYYKLLEDNLVEEDTTYYIIDGKDEIEFDAIDIKYDNIESGLEAIDVQGAINELNSKIGGEEMKDLYFGSIEEREALANAITDKGIETKITDSLLQMAANVASFSTPNVSGSPNLSAPNSTTPSFSAEVGKLYIVTFAVPGTANNCSLSSGATQLHKISQYRSCSSGMYAHTFLIRATATTVKFSMNDNPAMAWFKVEA